MNKLSGLNDRINHLAFWGRKTSLLDIFLGISEIVGKTNPLIPHHQLNVAYISARVCSLLGASPLTTRTVILASLFHDIGFAAIETRRRDIYDLDNEVMLGHSEIAYRMLKNPVNPKIVKKAAELIRYHHFDYTDSTVGSVPYESFIIRGADRLDVYTTNMDIPWKDPKSVRDKVKSLLIPKEIKDALLYLTEQSSFWFDLKLSKEAKEEFLRTCVSWPVFNLDSKSMYVTGKALLSLIDFRSPITSTHSTRVATLARFLGEEMELGEVSCTTLEIGGYLHDVGKLAVPVDILEKPSRLSEEEYAIIQTHVYYTYSFLKELGMYRDITNVASFHHERTDGSGYPFGLKGEDLSVEERIMAVSDVYSALCEHRPYKKSLSMKEAFSIVQNMARDGKLCPKVVEVLNSKLDYVSDLFKIVISKLGEDYEKLMNEVKEGTKDLASMRG